MAVKNRLSRDQRGFAHLGNHPDSINSEGKSQKSTIEYFWVGVEVVQKRNIRKKTDGELVYNPEPEKWGSPVYLILQRSITMPPLGESLHLNEWTARRLLEQMPEGCLLTAAQGGPAIARDIKEQIVNGVSLPELSKGEYGFQKRTGLPDGANLSEMFGNLDDEEIQRILKKRGISITKEESTEEESEEKQVEKVAKVK